MNRTDVIIVGGGPVGLYAAFYVGLRGLSARVIEARPELGGQLSALYPEKFIYDAPGFPKVRARELVERLTAQAGTFKPELNLGETALRLNRDGDLWRVSTGEGAYAAKAVILAAGIGALVPRTSSVPGAQDFGRVYNELPGGQDWTAQDWVGKRALVFGGVPQAVEAALRLAGNGAAVTLAHKRALFRGTPERLARLEVLRQAGKVEVLAPADLIRFTPSGAELSVGSEIRRLELDGAFYLGGYLPDLAPLRDWGMEWQGEYVVAREGGTTNLPGVFVAGDLSLNGGDFKLIAAGFAQAALAANYAAHLVRPDLRVRPGHSSDKKVPRQTETV